MPTKKLNKNQYQTTNATVVVNTEKPITDNVSYNNCEVEKRGDNYQVTPQKRKPRRRNRQVYQKDEVKVMDRKNHTYMMYVEINADKKGWKDHLTIGINDAFTYTQEYHKLHKKLC